MKTNRVIAPIVLLGAVACGTEPTDLDATLEAPAPTEAEVSISAALEVSDLLDAGLADRVVIDDIRLNLAEVRLLAADPRIPPGGFNLLSQATILEFYGADESKLDLPFPEQFLGQDDLAVYLHIAPSAALDASSIIVTGRYYASPIHGGQSSLKTTASAEDHPDDPVEGRKAKTHDSDPRLQAQDPDGDPVHCAQDPDGDPVMCGQKKLVERGSAEASIAFELRTADVADLVASLAGETEQLDVVVGIPASRWFTDDVVQSFEQALRDAANATPRKDDPRAGRDDVLIIESAERAMTDRMRADRDGYFVTSRDIDDALTVRR